MKQMIWAVPVTLCLAAVLAFGQGPSQGKNETAKQDGSQAEPQAKVDLGGYTMSLNVKDIEQSLAFYATLGFAPVEGMGAVEQRWIIISNGEMQMGLFQGMFPQNTLTFHPADGRAVYQELLDKGVQPNFATGMEAKEGPCTFSISDPDGNPILIDQH